MPKNILDTDICLAIVTFLNALENFSLYIITFYVNLCMFLKVINSFFIAPDSLTITDYCKNIIQDLEILYDGE